MTAFKYEMCGSPAGRGAAVEDKRVGRSSRITLDFRKEMGVHSSADALGWRIETGSGKVA